MKLNKGTQHSPCFVVFCHLTLTYHIRSFADICLVENMYKENTYANRIWYQFSIYIYQQY